MAKLSLADVSNFNSSTAATINANWALIEAALELTLSRDGTSPNQLTADVDMNDNDVLNAGIIDCNQLIVGGETFSGVIPTWYAGAGAPSSGLGTVGDMYLDGVTGDVYGPKTLSGWGSSSVNIKGPTGATGATGSTGSTGAQGEKGWSPVFAIATDGSRRVLQVVDWVGGVGTKPSTGDYVDESGLTSVIGDAVDIRGPQGPQGTAGAGTGDMLAATYDPTSVSADAFDMDNMVEGSTNLIMTGAERAKLAGIAAGATVNSSDATLLARANHTGTQSADTITDGSTNKAYTGTEKTKLAGIASGAQVNTVTSVNSETGAVVLTTDDISDSGQTNKWTTTAEKTTFKSWDMTIACSDETTALTTGAAKVTFRMPRAVTLTAIRASLVTAQTSGSIFTVDVNESGSTILSTKITIDNNEKTSTTAATAPVLSDTSLADDAEMTIDIDQIGNGTAKGLKVTLIGTHA